MNRSCEIFAVIGIQVVVSGELTTEGRSLNEVLGTWS